jgi:hypothetical protein
MGHLLKEEKKVSLKTGTQDAEHRTQEKFKNINRKGHKGGRRI